MTKLSRSKRYLEMHKKLESKSDEWMESKEGVKHLDEMDRLWGQLSDDELERIQGAMLRIRFDGLGDRGKSQESI